MLAVYESFKYEFCFCFVNKLWTRQLCAGDQIESPATQEKEGSDFLNRKHILPRRDTVFSYLKLSAPWRSPSGQLTPCLGFYRRRRRCGIDNFSFHMQDSGPCLGICNNRRRLKVGVIILQEDHKHVFLMSLMLLLFCPDLPFRRLVRVKLCIME